MKRLILIFALLLIVGLIIGLAAALRRDGPGNDRLVISQITLASRTNGAVVNQTVSFTISNQSPRGLHFSIPWFECRGKSSFTLVTNAYGQYSPVRLPAREVATSTMDLPASAGSNEGYLFCCMVHWQEEEPILWRVGRKLEPWVSRTLFVINTQWLPPWESGTLASGWTVASNVDVEEYFRLAYGFTRSELLEERARNEMARMNTDRSIVVQKRYGLDSTDDTKLKLEARSAFAAFCAKTTNVAENIRSSGSPPPPAPHK